MDYFFKASEITIKYFVVDLVVLRSLLCLIANLFTPKAFLLLIF